LVQKKEKGKVQTRKFHGKKRVPCRVEFGLEDAGLWEERQGLGQRRIEEAEEGALGQHPEFHESGDSAVGKKMGR
jgi:hypothetical protein